MSKSFIDAPTLHSDGSVSGTLSGIDSDITVPERTLIPLYREGQPYRGLMFVFPHACSFLFLSPTDQIHIALPSLYL